MRYPIRVRPEVEGEIVEAMAWYEIRSPSLGTSFYRRYTDVLRDVSERPETYRKVRGEVRRVIFRGFPYVLFYVFEAGEIIVLSCLHERRSPEMWPDQG